MEWKDQERIDGQEVLQSQQHGSPQRRQRKPGGIPPQFPKRLHAMLSRADDDGFCHIVSWRPHGKSFTVYDREKFVRDVMPRYFQQTKFTSFQRQLNLYGFRRINETGPDYNGYYHESFVREYPELVDSIARVTSKPSPPSSLSPTPKPSSGMYDRPTSPSSAQASRARPHFNQLNLLQSIPTHVSQANIPLNLATLSSTPSPSSLPFAPFTTLQAETARFHATRQFNPFNNTTQFTPNIPQAPNTTNRFINTDVSAQWPRGMHQRLPRGMFMGQQGLLERHHHFHRTFMVQPFSQQPSPASTVPVVGPPPLQPSPPLQAPPAPLQKQQQELITPYAGIATNFSDFADVDDLVRSTEQLLESLPLVTQNRTGILAQQDSTAASSELPEGTNHSYPQPEQQSASATITRRFPTDEFTLSEGEHFNEPTDMNLFGLCDDLSQKDDDDDNDDDGN